MDEGRGGSHATSVHTVFPTGVGGGAGIGGDKWSATFGTILSVGVGTVKVVVDPVRWKVPQGAVTVLGTGGDGCMAIFTNNGLALYFYGVAFSNFVGVVRREIVGVVTAGGRNTVVPVGSGLSVLGWRCGCEFYKLPGKMDVPPGFTTVFYGVGIVSVCFSYFMISGAWCPGNEGIGDTVSFTVDVRPVGIV